MNQSPNDMDGTDSEVFLVGDLRVDVGQQRVTRAGIEITLPNLSLQLLIALIRVAPNVLSHDSTHGTGLARAGRESRDCGQAGQLVA